MRGFQRRGVSTWDIWEEVAEREAYVNASSLITRIEMDFGPEIAFHFGETLTEEVGIFDGRPVSMASPPQAAAHVKAALADDGHEIAPLALPDEVFGTVIQAGVDILRERDLNAFADVLGSVYPGLNLDWLNNVLAKHRAPCRVVDGAVEWRDGLAAEQPLATLETWPDLRADLRRIREAYRQASSPDDFNAIGARCVRLLITLGRLGFDAAVDLPAGETEPSPDDCKARLNLMIQARATGKQWKAARDTGPSLVVGAYGQAERAKHARDAGQVDAAVAISLASALIDLVAGLTGGLST